MLVSRIHSWRLLGVLAVTLAAVLGGSIAITATMAGEETAAQGSTAKARAHETKGHAASGAGRLEEAQAHFAAWVQEEDEHGHPRTHAQALRALASVLARRGKLDEAIRHLDRAVARLRTQAVGGLLGAVLNDRGALHQARGASEQARRDLEEAAQVLEHHGAPRSALQARWNLGLLHESRGEMELALETYRAALATAKDLDSKTLVGRASLSVGSVLHRLGDDEEARALLDEALAAARTAEDVVLLAQARSELATIDLHQGASDRALQGFRDALIAFHSHGDPVLITRALGNVGTAHEHRGEYADALRAFERALAHAVEAGDLEGEAGARLSRARVHAVLGEQREALVDAQLALERATTFGDPLLEARVHGVLARLLEGEGDDKASRAHLEEAMRLSTGAGDARAEGRARMQLGDAERSAGHLDKARAHFTAALEQFEAIGDVAEVAACAVRLAECALGAGLLGRALEQSEEARKAARRAGARDVAIDALVIAANARLAQGDAAGAQALARQAANDVPFLTRGLDELRGAAGRSRWRAPFRVGLAAALAQDDATGAFWFLEAGRAGQLRESLGGASGLGARVLTPEQARADEAARSRVQAASSRYRRVVRRRGSLAAHRKARKALADAEDAVRALAARWQLESRDAAGVLYPRPSTIREVRAVLAGDEAFVAYSLGEPSQAFVLTREAIRIVPLAIAATLDAAIAAVMDGEEEVAARSAERLGPLLAAPLALPASVTRVIVSPEGALARIPFSLVFPEREVAHVPSATTYVLLRGQRGLRGTRVLGIGAPDYRHHDRRLAALPGSGDEVRRVADVTLLGERATEREFRARLPDVARWRAVHFACHGLIDDDRPSLSSLALTRDDVHDGNLTVMEVLDLRAPADLVTLSACDSGRGRILEGEGILGFTRAFMFAGAARVIVSLWKVDDEATAHLMRELYARWNPGGTARGVPLATALRQAQSVVRKQPKWRHPRYWAAWALWGLPDAARDAQVVLSREEALTRTTSAFDRKDRQALAALAARAQPDPWLLVDALEARGRRDVARALAAEATATDVAKLGSHAATDARSDPSWRERLARARKIRAGGDTRLLRPLLSGPGLVDDVLGVEVPDTLGTALAASVSIEDRLDAVAPLAEAGRRAARMGWLSRAAACLARAARLAERLGQYGQAARILRELATLQTRRQRAADAAAATGDLGVIFQRMGRVEDAAVALKAAMASYERLEDVAGVARSAANLAALEFARGRMDEARSAAERARDAARRAELPEVEGAALGNLGLALEARAEHAAAVETQELAIARLAQVGDTRTLGRIHDNLANLLAGLNRLEDAERHHLRAVEIAVDRGDAPGEARARGNAAMTALDAGRLAEARRQQQLAVALWSSLGVADAKAHALSAVGWIAEARGSLGAALAAYEAAEATLPIDAPAKAHRAARERCVEAALAAGRYVRAIELTTREGATPELANKVNARLAATDRPPATASSRDRELAEACRARDAAKAFAALQGQAWEGAVGAYVDRALAMHATLPTPVRTRLLEARARVTALSERANAPERALTAAQAVLAETTKAVPVDAWAVGTRRPTLADIQSRLASHESLLVTFDPREGVTALAITKTAARLVGPRELGQPQPAGAYVVPVDGRTHEAPWAAALPRVAPQALLAAETRDEAQASEGVLVLAGPRAALPQDAARVFGNAPVAAAPSAWPGAGIRAGAGMLQEGPLTDALRGPWNLVVFDAQLILAAHAMPRTGLYVGPGVLPAADLNGLELPARVWAFPHVSGRPSAALLGAWLDACHRGGARVVLWRAGPEPVGGPGGFLSRFGTSLAQGAAPAAAFQAAGGAKAGWRLAVDK